MPQIINAKILRDDELENVDKPSLSALVACTSHNGIEGLLPIVRKIAPHVDELVIAIVGKDPVDTSSWKNALPDVCQKVVIDLSSLEFPHLYFADLPESYEHGEPLADESIGWSFGSCPVVADWSFIRDLCQISCSCDYIVHHRPGQILTDPEHLRGACLLLAEHGRTHAASITRGVGRSSIDTVLTNRLSYLRWIDPCREQVSGGSITIIEGSLLTSSTDMAKTDLKILYAHARNRAWQVDDKLLLQLAQVARQSQESSFASSCVDLVLARSKDPEARATASCLKGESLISLARAGEWYERSLVEYPTWKASLRLSRTRFHQRRWQECHEYHDLAVSLVDRTTCLLDDAPLDLRSALLLDTAALKELGKYTEARRNCPILLAAFPTSPSVRELCLSIG